MSRTVDIVDNEIKRFLNPTGSTPYSYCVQVHGACRTYGSKNALPTITWANSAHTALRLEGVPKPSDRAKFWRQAADTFCEGPSRSLRRIWSWI
ncbi:hypothetical protein V1505DRAFT_371744 [Lipomyces doorenjongii]